MTAISMTPAVVMAETSPIVSRAIDITVRDTPHHRTPIPIDHGTIDIAVNDAANDRPVINMADDHGAVIAITATIAVAPSGLSRCRREARKH
jgi:hypothetical protein